MRGEGRGEGGGGQRGEWERRGRGGRGGRGRAKEEEEEWSAWSYPGYVYLILSPQSEATILYMQPLSPITACVMIQSYVHSL